MKTTLIALLALGLIIGCSKNPEINEEIEEKPEWNPSAGELDTLTENVKADIGRRFVQHGMTIDSFSLTHKEGQRYTAIAKFINKDGMSHQMEFEVTPQSANSFFWVEQRISAPKNEKVK